MKLRPNTKQPKDVYPLYYSIYVVFALLLINWFCLRHDCMFPVLIKLPFVERIGQASNHSVSLIGASLIGVRIFCASCCVLCCQSTSYCNAVNWRNKECIYNRENTPKDIEIVFHITVDIVHCLNSEIYAECTFINAVYVIYK